MVDPRALTLTTPDVEELLARIAKLEEALRYYAERGDMNARAVLADPPTTEVRRTRVAGVDVAIESPFLGEPEP